MSILFAILAILGILLLINFLLLKFSCNKVDHQKSLKKERDFSMADE